MGENVAVRQLQSIASNLLRVDPSTSGRKSASMHRSPHRRQLRHFETVSSRPDPTFREVCVGEISGTARERCNRSAEDDGVRVLITVDLAPVGDRCQLQSLVSKSKRSVPNTEPNGYFFSPSLNILDHLSLGGCFMSPYRRRSFMLFGSFNRRWCSSPNSSTSMNPLLFLSSR